MTQTAPDEGRRQSLDFGYLTSPAARKRKNGVRGCSLPRSHSSFPNHVLTKNLRVASVSNRLKKFPRGADGGQAVGFAILAGIPKLSLDIGPPIHLPKR